MVKIGNDWDEILKDDFNCESYIRLRSFLIEEYKNNKIYPDKYDIFNALRETSFEDTKAVIIGQDPYHGNGQAHGMCFSVKKGVKIPPSLLNIYKEINREYGYPIANHGYLMKWANQGVLLLNTILTVREGSPMSHKNMGWETLTDSIIKKLNEKKDPIVFLLWGAAAIKKKEMISNKKHLILTSVHPSPLSANRGFFGNNHFKLCNEFLSENGQSEIDWKII